MQFSNTGTFNKTYINRDKTCPILLRVFLKEDNFHDIEEFKSRSELPVQDEIQIYVWRNSTLREITNLIKKENLKAREKASQLSFRFVYPDLNGKYHHNSIGTVHSSKKNEDDQKTLEDLYFNYHLLSVCLKTDKDDTKTQPTPMDTENSGVEESKSSENNNNNESNINENQKTTEINIDMEPLNEK
ncbi:hypothetical protein DLAC_00849 [Tieghemostelium lacteum]|uniref:Histone deacetylase complex subunit SAP18 n=1 Tax=Tieghemostelium lacteum TaxID=361077 RepID=A0A152A7E8_TIELA|nr:hypothetical protein DLAC_00849 [Tieghemostelium lacteum]|eukprot:KYR02051.1 hypothetical protein DLAC_00849 [Tieghemostelium lacteum]